MAADSRKRTEEKEVCKTRVKLTVIIKQANRPETPYQYTTFNTMTT